MDFPLHIPDDITGIDQTKRLSDVLFFKFLGFSEVESMEFGTDESANYVHDLNDPVPVAYFEQFDSIYDGGTCEHVFNIPTCLRSIIYMLKIGGRILHDAGVSGTIDHGFYALQPTLFYDYYLTQGFQIDMCSVFALNKDQRFTNFVLPQIHYTPGMYDFEDTWAIDAQNVFGVFFCATKILPFMEPIPPQQSIWARIAAKSA